jgi:hypothetical protein
VQLFGVPIVHGPSQPAKTLGPLGAAVNVTTEPSTYCSSQSALPVTAGSEQAIPGGSELTLPDPVPFTWTVSVKRASNLALTVRAWSIVTVHGDPPLQAPPQAEKTLAPAGAAVSVTDVPTTKSFAQPGPGTPAVIVHEIPTGCEVIVPLPLPSPVIVNGKVRSTNSAVTERASLIVT